MKNNKCGGGEIKNVQFKEKRAQETILLEASLSREALNGVLDKPSRDLKRSSDFPLQVWP